MIHKKTLPLIIALLGSTLSAYGFKIINQTNNKKVLKLTEAYCPESKGNETLARPQALYTKPLKVTVPARSSANITLRKHCSGVLISDVESNFEKKAGGI